jgi:hypothetical protein
MTEESSQPEVPEATAPGREATSVPEPAREAGGDAGAGPPPDTGDPRVDEALAALEGLGEVPDSEHVEAFEHVHRQLQEILGEVGGEHGNRARPPGRDGR